jgi:hypothetical protein
MYLYTLITRSIISETAISSSSLYGKPTTCKQTGCEEKSSGSSDDSIQQTPHRKEVSSKSGLTHIISRFIKGVIQGFISKIFWIFLSRNLEIFYWKGDGWVVEDVVKRCIAPPTREIVPATVSKFRKLSVRE